MQDRQWLEKLLALPVRHHTTIEKGKQGLCLSASEDVPRISPDFVKDSQLEADTPTFFSVRTRSRAPHTLLRRILHLGQEQVGQDCPFWHFCATVFHHEHSLAAKLR